MQVRKPATETEAAFQHERHRTQGSKAGSVSLESLEVPEALRSTQVTKAPSGDSGGGFEASLALASSPLHCQICRPNSARRV